MPYPGLQGKSRERRRNTKEEDLNSEDIFCFQSKNRVKFNIIMDIDNIVSQFNNLSIEDRASALKKMQMSLEEARKAQEPQKPRWADRTSGREVTPVDFIKMHYGTWNGDQWSPDGLTRRELINEDRTLYNAYAQQIKRKPESDLKLETAPHKRVDDPMKALERYRESTRKASRRYSEKRRQII